jgi:hypothetical protein
MNRILAATTQICTFLFFWNFLTFIKGYRWSVPSTTADSRHEIRHFKNYGDVRALIANYDREQSYIMQKT